MSLNNTTIYNFSKLSTYIYPYKRLDLALPTKETMFLPKAVDAQMESPVLSVGHCLSSLVIAGCPRDFQNSRSQCHCSRNSPELVGYGPIPKVAAHFDRSTWRNTSQLFLALGDLLVIGPTSSRIPPLDLMGCCVWLYCMGSGYGITSPHLESRHFTD